MLENYKQNTHNVVHFQESCRDKACNFIRHGLYCKNFLEFFWKFSELTQRDLSCRSKRSKQTYFLHSSLIFIAHIHHSYSYITLYGHANYFVYKLIHESHTWKFCVEKVTLAVCKFFMKIRINMSQKLQRRKDLYGLWN